jgi:hypothetical protein
LKKEEEKGHTYKLEHGLITIYDLILDSAQAPEISVEDNINMVAQTIEIDKQEIEDSKESLNPTTPSEVQEQREQQSAL